MPESHAVLRPFRTRCGPGAGPGDPARRRGVVPALALAVALTVGGCSSSSSSSPQTAPTPSSSGGRTSGGGGSAVATKLDIGQVAGTARKAKYRTRFRASVPAFEKKVGKAVDGWFDNAFVGVGYPRAGFGHAFDTFTGPAAADAHRQKRLMTDYGLRHSIDGVTVTQRHVWVDVLAPGGVIAGATARFRLGFTTTGDTKRKVLVSGRLFLSRTSGGAWRIFGFDVTKGGAR